MARRTREETETLVRELALQAAGVRAQDIVALDVGPLVDYTDILLLVTGGSARRNRAISERITRHMKDRDELPLSRSGRDAGTWICLDYVDFVVHVFDQETRDHYDLELLWADAERFDLQLPEGAIQAPEPIEEEEYDEDVILPSE